MVDEVLDLLCIVAGCGEGYDAGLAVAVFAGNNIIGNCNMSSKDGVYEALYNDGIESQCQKVVYTGLAVAIDTCDAAICCSEGSGITAGDLVEISVCYLFDFVAHFIFSF